MCERILEGRKRKPKNEEDDLMGFADFGGYFEAKKTKLVEQYKSTAANTETKSNIFYGIAIFVNGLTNPSAADLKKLMAEHGGMYHGYQMSSTTHIIASNLAYAKTKNLGSVPIVKAAWITDSIELKKVLDYRRYLLFSNQSAAQPRLNFPVVPEDEKITEVSTSKKEMSEKSETLDVRNKISKTASDPRFLEEFYNNSRLHLIATMGAEFKQLVGQLREKSDGNFPRRTFLATMVGNPNNKRAYASVIMHIDMDCFFVSVGIRNKPELKGKPVAVTHARNGQLSSASSGRSTEIAMNLERAPENIIEKITGIDSHSSMSEIACCSYEARKCGIKNGMFLGTAVKLCPGLKTIQYDFQGYKDVAATLYETVAAYTLDIEAVSCDEMYVDITKLLNDTGSTVEQFATHLRNEIMEKTGCPCSTGFGANRLQARLATKKAKPNGQFYLQVDDVEAYFAEIPVGDLPGVGRATLAKLKNLGLNTCGDVQSASLGWLQAELGQKLGETLLEQAKGNDRKPLNFNHERKSVSAEINYGIRFKTLEESYNFLQSLSQEVFNRLNDVGMKAKCLTLKLMVRAPDAPMETAKFLGHGICDSLSKSTTSNIAICDVKTVFKEAKQLYDKFNVPFADLRGVGIQLTKLEKYGPANNVMSNFLKQNSKKNGETTETKPEKVTSNRLEFIHTKSEENIEKTRDSQMKNSSKTKETKPKKATPGKSKMRSKSSPSLMLDKFLSNFRTPVKEQNMSNSHSIDLDILHELPEEIRNEIIREYKLQQPSQTKKCDPIEEPEIITENLEPAKKVGIESPFDGLTWEEVKPILKTWMSSENEPTEIDVAMISEYLQGLAVRRNIEQLVVIFNFLHRSFAKLSCKWHKAYFLISNMTQQGMVARYGGTLKVKRKFVCCG